MRTLGHLNLARPIGFSLAILLMLSLLGTTTPSQATPQASITFPSGSTVGGGDDFATVVLRDPWDMNESSDVWEINNISNVAFSGGIMSFRTATADPYFWVLHQGYGSAQNIGKTGVADPIDASKYRFFSFRMYSSVAGLANIYWFYDPIYSKYAWSNWISIQTGWHVYTVDLLNYVGGNYGGATGWSGTVTGLRLNPIKTAGVDMQLDWVRLTPLDTTHMLPLGWSGVSGSSLGLYLDEDTSGCDGPQIASISSPSSSGTFTWGAALGGPSGLPYPLPVNIAPGNYYVCGKYGSSTVYSSGTLTVKGTPMLWVTHPSYLTGPDYATNAGVPWNMDNSNAFKSILGLDSYQFSGGQFNATNTGGDPRLRFNTPVTVDTSKYKYFSVRMWLEGNWDLYGGWVARALWAASAGSLHTTTDDIVIYPGWNTYTLDLTKAILEPGGTPWQAGSWGVFRFDPNENIRGVPWTFHIDYALLTGNPTGRINSQVPIWYELSETSGVTVTLYYDADTNPSNGKTLVQVYTAPAPSPCGPVCVYLPLVVQGYPPPGLTPTGTKVIWNTAGVSAGAYYIMAEITDGYNTARWYSDVPFVLTN